jgi:hypothetical protein
MASAPTAAAIAPANLHVGGSKAERPLAADPSASRAAIASSAILRRLLRCLVVKLCSQAVHAPAQIIARKTSGP